MSIFDWQVAFHYGFDAIYLQQKKRTQRELKKGVKMASLQVRSTIQCVKL